MQTQWLLPAALILGWLCPSSYGEDAKTFNVAVCDLSRVFNDCNWTKDKQAELEVRRAQFQNELEEAKKKLEALDRELPLLEKGSQQFKDKQTEIDDLKAQVKAKTKVESTHLERKFSDFLKEFFDRAQEIVGAVAKERGFNLVIQQGDRDLSKLERAESLQFRISTQMVLFADPAINITSDVLKRMNEDYEKQKKTGTE